MSLKQSFVYWFAILCCTSLTAAAAPQPEPARQGPPERPRNVILLIADGTGPATITMARDYLRDQFGVQELALDGILVGSARTYSTDSRVTDSAAGATAFSAGVKTYNGAIAVDSLQRPVATVLEAAEAAGMATGLVATSTITHATPASFSAHVPSRAKEDAIAEQQIEQGIEVLFGGGRWFFLPEADGGRRGDDRNLLEAARDKGYQVLLTRQDLRKPVRLPVLGLFSMDHMDYEIDRDSLVQPSLAEMTAKAIDLLADDPDGFFLMVEGSRIDHAGHANDPAAHLHDAIAYDRAVATALDFARRDGNTLVISVSDHETGGLSLGRNLDGRGVYAWHPGALARVRASVARMTAEVTAGGAPERVLAKWAGVNDLTNEEKALLREADASGLGYVLGELISRRAVVAWTTTGHTAVDVNLYAFGPGSERLRGHHDNTYVGQVIADLFGFDLEALTAALRRHGAH